MRKARAAGVASAVNVGVVVRTGEEGNVVVEEAGVSILDLGWQTLAWLVSLIARVVCVEAPK